MIKIEKLNKTYDRHRRNANHVLKDVTFALPETGFVCILGPSGCGKTSLLNAIGGLDRFDSGSIETENVSVSRYGKRAYEAERNRNFGYIFQNYYLLAEHSVAYNIYLGLHSLKLSHREKLQRIRQALEAVDMSRYIRRKVGELSGGQQQRIAIARALARQPRVIFADEPTGNLDEANTMNICTLLRKISRQSLVVMVTHEERIANFFADRIIRLDGGVVSEDREEWQRDGISMSAEKEVYAGDYDERCFEADQVSLRVLQEEGAAPVEVTVVALKDRILIKLSDNRAISCGAAGQVPILREGKRPTITLDAVDQSEHRAVTDRVPAAQSRAGRGIGFGMMLREAGFLAKGGGAKRVGMRLFLILLTLLTVWTAADYITVASVNPRDFVTTESHILEIRMKRGNVGTNTILLEDYYNEFNQKLAASDVGLDFIPSPATALGFSMRIFAQMENVQEYLKEFSYVPLTRLDEKDLILGRMPQAAGEAVVDTWVLEKLLEDESIIKNAVSDVSFFLGKELMFERGNTTLTVVGISDSTEPAVYLMQTDLIRMGTGMYSVMGLSEFKAGNPGVYDDLTLSDQECIVNAYVAGSAYLHLAGEQLYYRPGFSWKIVQTIQGTDKAAIIVSDAEAQRYLMSQCGSHYYLYCEDKEATKELLEQMKQSLRGKIVVDVIDEYTDAYNAYTEASQLKVDARRVVTVTVMLICMVMLYLLCRSQAQQRIGMMAVYRLLGIPKHKLAVIFAQEAVLSSLSTALPAAGLAWLVINLLSRIDSLQVQLLLPWQAALGVYGAVLAYHILVALLPLWSLLHMPPAQLAAKYDY